MSITKFTVYQEKDPTFRVDDSKTEYNLGDYNEVYEMVWNRWEVPADRVILEAMFDTFNGEVRPSKFRGRSMSVGDIVKIDNTAYICTDFGWSKINLK